MSNLDVTQIQKLKYDSEKKADRVVLVNEDLEMELSAEDGDSVVSKCLTQAIFVQENQEVDLSMASKVCLVGDSETATLVATVEGIEVLSLTLKKGEITPVCITTAKIKNISGQKVFLMVQ